MQDIKNTLVDNKNHEFEIVEFSVGNTVYGINVAKVREAINLLPVTKMPNAHPYIEGVITLRGKVLPLINLAACLNIKNSDPKRIIIAELNRYKAGFLVDEVFRIHYTNWENVEPAPKIANSELIIGVVKLEHKVIVLLDFEHIISIINPDMNKPFEEFNPIVSPEKLKQNINNTIMLVDDSPFLRKILVDNLQKAGYHNIISVANGKDAWTQLEELKAENDNIFDAIQMIVTDIEMPCLDGLSLLNLIRSDEKLKQLPVIIFSSLLNNVNLKKATTLGTTDQIAKPNIENLVDSINKHIK